jgi:hypothetical protein
LYALVTGLLEKGKACPALMRNTCTYYGYAGKTNYVPRCVLAAEWLAFVMLSFRDPWR